MCGGGLPKLYPAVLLGYYSQDSGACSDANKQLKFDVEPTA